MPIMQFHLVTQAYSPPAIADLLTEASAFFAASLYPDLSPVPVERVRALVCDIAPGHAAVGGRIVGEGAEPAPFFTCMTIVGRPREQLDAMMRGISEIVVRVLGCDRSLVRGLIVPVAAEDWYIGGEPASAARGTELARRASMR